jgi:hypothetical protein
VTTVDGPTGWNGSLPERIYTAVVYGDVVDTGALLIGLVAVAAGLPSVFRPQAVIDFGCEVSPFCRAPRQLSLAGRTLNRILGGGLALVGALLVAGSLVGTLS